MGRNSAATFKDAFQATSTFVGGYVSPEKILIVGLDIPLEEWNADLWDQARLELAKKNPVNPKDVILLNGFRDPISVTRRKNLILCVDGRRKVLGARAANEILRKAKTPPDQWIECPVYVDKSTDLDVSVRLSNEGRLDDPPWVKARNAGYLRARGKDDKTIRAAFGGIQPQTLYNYFTYLNLIPELRRRVEDEELPKSERIPFFVGVEIAKLGDGEGKSQRLAYAYLVSVAAKLTGLDGRNNAARVVQQIQSGEITEVASAGRSTLETAEEEEEEEEEEGAEYKERELTLETAEEREAPNKTPRPSRPRNIIANGKLSFSHVRQILAHLEPTQYEPLETVPEQVTYAVLSAITGQDKSGESLKRWPEVYDRFRKYLRSEEA